MKTCSGPKRQSLTISAALIAGLFLLPLPASALKGTVHDWQNQPASGCEVRLSASSSSVAVENGTFQFDPTSTRHIVSNAVSKEAFVKGRYMHFPAAGEVSLRAYSLDGRVLAGIKRWNLASGKYRLDMGGVLPELTAGGVYLIQLKTGTLIASFTYIPVSAPVRNPEPERVSGNAAGLAKSAVALDTLLITCPGSPQKKLPVSDYKADLGTIVMGKPPHIVFVLTDDQGYGEIGAHGNTIIKTPNIDKFWAKSTRLTNFHVGTTCAPTRAQIMSGRHEFRVEVTHTIQNRERMALSAHTIAQVLKDAGYATAIFGKWHLGDPSEYRPDNRGFQEALVHGAGGLGQVSYGDHKDNSKTPYHDPTLYHNGKFEVVKGYCTEIWFREAIKWMRQNKDTPMFTFISTNTPHTPVIVDKSYSSMYSGLYGQGEGYYGMITCIDDYFGYMMDSLKVLGMEENTIVIFMTDNGHAIPSPGAAGHNADGTLKPNGLYNAGMRGGKAQPWEGGTRVPSFWYWPGQFREGLDIDRLTGGIDLYPTFAEIAGATIPDSVVLDGKSFLPLLKNPSHAWSDRYLVIHVGRWRTGKADASKYSNMAVRSQRWRWVNNKELHDMVNDPGETTNVIEQYPDTAAAMKAFYDKWWDETRPLMGTN